MTDAQSTLLTFPCSFPLKVIGKDEQDFTSLVVAIVRKHVPQLRDDSVQRTLSGGGKYVSLTMIFTAESKEQIDALYRELSEHESVLVVL